MATGIIAALAVSGMAFAKSAARSGGKANNPAISQANQRPKLSDSQKEQIKAIVKDFHAKAKEIWKSNVTDTEKNAQIEALRAKSAESINAVLTPEQQSNPMVQKMIQRMLGPGIGAKLKWLADQLGLTEAQRTQIKEISKDARQQAKAIRQDTTLARQQQKEKILQLKQDTITKIKAVLTPEQLQKLNDILAQHPEWSKRLGQ